MASIKDILFGKRGKFEQLSTLTPQQQELMGSLFGGLGGQLGAGFGAIGSQLGGSQDFLNQLQAPALRQFQEQTIPNIAERFSGLGAQGSSAFGQQLGAAGAGLAENLAAQRGALGIESQQQGLANLMTLLGLVQKPQFQNVYRPGTQGLTGPLLQGLGSGLGSFAGGGIGQGIGALGGLLGNLFNKKPQRTQLEEGAYGLYPTSGLINASEV